MSGNDAIEQPDVPENLKGVSVGGKENQHESKGVLGYKKFNQKEKIPFIQN